MIGGFILFFWYILDLSEENFNGNLKILFKFGDEGMLNKQVFKKFKFS